MRPVAAARDGTAAGSEGGKVPLKQRRLAWQAWGCLLLRRKASTHRVHHSTPLQLSASDFCVPVIS